MIAKKIKASPVSRLDSSSYLKRARELLESMRNNMILENWNAAVIDGVHCAISINDALTTASISKRCTSSHHMDAVTLLKQAIPDHLSPESARLRRIINIKSHVEYGPSLVTQKDALALINDAEKFFSWAEKTYRIICESSKEGN